ncbi:hypothetical protein H072_4816 [Dactylellina haptotyla CBS 200.50]|uniref:Uncharacterized protein n=1 Tax=Dactylellina haptotyla (strain CBS 200.50) TaxID=1284197 RepID=S8AE32_DACHA|nr:hypothetical protein H072_4816 [Dactylellina haptotyla CBS 200.50]
MAPFPTVTPDVFNTTLNKRGFSFDASTIAAVALGIALFCTILGIFVYCIWTRKRKSKQYIHKVEEGEAGQWTIVARTPGKCKKQKRESLLQTYAKRLSISRQSPAIDINKIGHPKLIQSSQDPEPPLAELKAAYIRAYNQSNTPSIIASRNNSVDLAPEKPAIKIHQSPLINTPKPPVTTVQPLKIDKKRPMPPKLTIPGSSQTTGNAITSTTVAGLTTNIYVPPTPSRTQFGDGPLSPRYAPKDTGPISPSHKSVCDYFSPDEIKPYPSPPPKDRHRFSDPTTPTPASQRSVRSLSWNGRTEHSGYQSMAVNPAFSPLQPKTPNIYSPRHNWIPMDVERVSMQTHPQSRAVSFSSQVQKMKSKDRKPMPAAHEEDEILTDDDEGSVIESDDEGETPQPLSNRMYTLNNRSSVRTGRTTSTRFSQDSIPNPPFTPFFGEVKGSPYMRGFAQKNSSRSRLGDDTPRRPLSSPALEILRRPGDESPPMSPVTFQIDDNPLRTPKTPKLPFTIDPRDRIDAGRINDGSYPTEWKREMERQAAEDARAHRQATIRKQSSNNSLKVPSRNIKKKGVSFRLNRHSREDSDAKPILPPIDTEFATKEISLAETVRRIRPSWYALRTDDSEMSMF